MSTQATINIQPAERTQQTAEELEAYFRALGFEIIPTVHMVEVNGEVMTREEYEKRHDH